MMRTEDFAVRLRSRPALRPLFVLSVRAFDRHDMLRDADIAAGAEVEGLIERSLSSPQTAFIHAHYAKLGCFAARIDRA